MKTVFIYALRCPLTERIRYVGKSKNPARRLKDHLRERRRKYHVHCWLSSLTLAGHKPILEILDEVHEEHWPQWEVAYIEFFREQGCELTNSTPGGEAGPDNTGKKRSKEFCEGQRLARLGTKRLPETCARMRASMLGKKRKLESCARQSRTMTGRTVPLKSRKKLSLSKFGKRHTDNTSGFVGVSRHKEGKWAASFTVNQKTIYVGLFVKIEDAVFARALAIALQ